MTLKIGVALASLALFAAKGKEVPGGGEGGFGESSGGAPMRMVPAHPFEKMGRGLIAMATQGGVYVGWRLLAADSAKTSFDLYRIIGLQRVKLNREPISQTADWVDTACTNSAATYELVSDSGDRVQCRVTANDPAAPYFSVPITYKGEASKVAIADLDGDGAYDYVVKWPAENHDPGETGSHLSGDTYHLEARRSDGKLLWIYDLGKNIELGVWYAPFIAADLDGDKKAEVVVKVGPPGDLREKDGRVLRGPEEFAVLDGMTGKEIVRGPWIPRDGFGSYNHVNRNQLSVAYLDGGRPSLVVLRGTYDKMAAEAWNFDGKALTQVWKFDNGGGKGVSRKIRGQGAHSTLCVDVDHDGRDEVILGSMVLDDDGKILWSTGRGHCDAMYYGDLDPARPGMEIAYLMEMHQKADGGICQVAPETGNFIWKLAGETLHVHSSGMCSDLDALHPGLEIYGAECEPSTHAITETNRWLFSADGTLLEKGKLPYWFGLRSVFWNGDLQREFDLERVKDFGQRPISARLKGHTLQIADVVGDWREEIVKSCPGEIRLYTTVIPSMDRRVCLMQDQAYRARVLSSSMGYFQCPVLTYVPEALQPNLNISLVGTNGAFVCRVVVAAPQTAAAAGTVSVVLPRGFSSAAPLLWRVALHPGERKTVECPVKADEHARAGTWLSASWQLGTGKTLIARTRY